MPLAAGLHPTLHVRRPARLSRAVAPFMEAGQITRLEAQLENLEALGCGDEVLAPLKKKLRGLKIADLEAQLEELTRDSGVQSPAPVADVSGPSPPPPPIAPPRDVEAEMAAARAAREARAAEAARAAAAQAEEAAEARAAQEASKVQTAAIAAAESELQMAVRQATVRRGLSAYEELDRQIEAATASGVARREALADARDELRAMATKSGLQARLDELRVARGSTTIAAEAFGTTAEAPAAAARPAEPATAVVAAQQAPPVIEPDADAAVATEEARAREEAKRAAEVLAREEEARRAAEIEACKAEIMSSLQMPADDRRRLLRRLQIRWHPDNFPGDDPAAAEAREFANVVARIANEAANKAKKVRNKEARAQKRGQALEALRAAMPSLLGGWMGSSTSAAALRAAIERAKEAGVSRVDIRDAEEALARMDDESK